MVMVKFGDKEYGMDGYLHRNIMAVNKMIRKDDDCVIVIDGRERNGKSVLAMQIACALDPTFNLDRVCLTPKDFNAKIFETDKYKCIILDEAMDIFYTKESMGSQNKYFNKVLAKIGQKNLIVILVLPSFFELDKYPALHRSRVLLHVYSKRKQRGYFSFYNYSKKLGLHIAGKKFYDYSKIRPNFRGRFSNAYPLDEQEYRKKKEESLVGSAEDIYTSKYHAQRDWMIGELNQFISIVKIADCFEGCDFPLKRATISGICKNHNGGENYGQKKQVGRTDGKFGRKDGKDNGSVEKTT